MIEARNIIIISTSIVSLINKNASSNLPECEKIIWSDGVGLGDKLSFMAIMQETHAVIDIFEYCLTHYSYDVNGSFMYSKCSIDFMILSFYIIPQHKLSNIN